MQDIDANATVVSGRTKSSSKEEPPAPRQGCVGETVFSISLVLLLCGSMSEHSRGCGEQGCGPPGLRPRGRHVTGTRTHKLQEATQDLSLRGTTVQFQFWGELWGPSAQASGSPPPCLAGQHHRPATLHPAAWSCSCSPERQSLRRWHLPGGGTQPCIAPLPVSLPGLDGNGWTCGAFSPPGS